MIRVVRCLAALFGALVLASVPALPVSADDSTVTVATLNEAWYATAPCSLPTGCGTVTSDPPASPYPAGTLHVGVVGGTETDRTYLSFDLGQLPDDASLTGGTLTVPLDTSAVDGSQSASAAHVDACLVTAPIERARGSLATPPPASCATKAPAVYNDSGGTPRLVIDLTALAPEWSQGAAAVALVPAQAAIDGHESWHVVFSARDRAAPPTPPATAALTYAVAPAIDEGASNVSTGEADTGLPSTESISPAAAAATSFLPSAAVSAPEPAAAPSDATTAAAAPAPEAPAALAVSTGGGPYQYPLVWLVPLVLLIGVGTLGRSLTRDLRGKT